MRVVIPAQQRRHHRKRYHRIDPEAAPRSSQSSLNQIQNRPENLLIFRDMSKYNQSSCQRVAREKGRRKLVNW